MSRLVGQSWLITSLQYDEFANIPHFFFSIDGASDVDTGPVVNCQPYNDYDPDTGEPITLYGGYFNNSIPYEAIGVNVVGKIYDPLNLNDILTLDPIDVVSNNLSITIGENWKNISGVYIKVNGFWKAIEATDIIVGGTFKEVF